MKILIAMSGGVDSSVTAHLLKSEGHDVAGITMLLGYQTTQGLVHFGEHAALDAKKVCDTLKIPHYTKDCTDIFDKWIIDNFQSEYACGRTPNPCVLCNRYLKFGALYREMKSMGFEALATGHYAAKGFLGTDECIKKNTDPVKDQSYFLYGIDKDVLKHLVFPLAEYSKDKVREIARSAGLPVAEKKDSQDICFINGDYREFPRIKEIISAPGNFVDKDGKVLGRHNGTHHYTIGQRRGLGVSAAAPLYVTSLNTIKNEVVLGLKEELLSRGLIAHQLNFFTKDIPGNVCVKIRYGKRETPCTAEITGDEMTIMFSEPLDAVTPGQSAVLYAGEYVIGGGIIDKVIS
jgi:tRNA-uridine 2-sulfurtransferase